MRHVLLIACGSFNPVTNMHLRMFELARDALMKSGRYRVLGGVASPVSDGYAKAGLLPAKHRLEMLQLALRAPPSSSNSQRACDAPAGGSDGPPASWVQPGAWESSRAAWTPTVRVLRHYQSAIDRALAEEEEEAQPCEVKRTKTDDPDDLAWLTQLVRRVKARHQAGPMKVDIRPVLLCGADVLQSFATPGVWEDEDMLSIVRDFGMVVLSRPGSDPEKFVHSFDLINPYQNNIFLVTEWAANDISSTLVRRLLRRNESVRYMLPDRVIDYIYRHRLYGSTAGWPRLENFADD